MAIALVALFIQMILDLKAGNSIDLLSLSIWAGGVVSLFSKSSDENDVESDTQD
jgi:hypothetical protein